MKCPQCGQWNRASLPRCQKCGAELIHDPLDTPAWKAQLKDDQKGKEYIHVDEDGDVNPTVDRRDSLAAEMAELKVRKEEGTRQQRQLRRSGAQRGAAPSGMTIRTHASVDTFWNVEDNPRSTVRVRRADGTEGHSVPRQSETWQDSRSYDPMWHEQEMYSAWQLPQNTQLTGKLPSRSRGLRRLLRVVLTVLMLCVTGLCIFFGYNFFKDRMGQNAQVSAATVTASMKDDMAAHTILIPGNDGEQIYIRELHASYIVTGGFATVEVADHIWYDDLTEIVGESMTVTLTPFMQTASGKQEPMDPITYSISIPESPITLVTPDGLYTTVSTAMYSMSFEVRPGSTVTINGEDVSDTVNAETGAFTYNATVQPKGDNVFDIRVRSQYCRENSMQLILYREPQEIPLDLSADTYSSTSERAIQIRATTMPGATVDVLTPHSDLNITHLDTTGAFTFMAVFDHIGYNDIKITASMPGKKTSVVEYRIYYLPSASEYTVKAWPLHAAEYAELLANITTRVERTQVYVAVGQIHEIINQNPQMAIVYTSEDGKSQPVLLENYTKTKWKVGEYYRIYGDAYGTYNSMPWLAARYTYPY